MKNHDYILQMEGITKHFPPVTALSKVTFSVRSGTVHALCGENGAGKSTLMKVLSGVHIPDAGKILIDGAVQFFTSPADAIAGGISMLYQELELAEHLKVYENIFLGREIISNKFTGKIDTAQEIKTVRNLACAKGFHINPESIIRDLPPGECQIVELIKALMRNAKIIVMDEPTSSLSDAEAQNLFRIIRQLKADGIAVIYISHRMEEVMDLADDISVLRDGKVVFTAKAADIDASVIVRHMVGREIDDYYPKRIPNIGETAFQARHLSSPNGIKDVSFEVKKGEIVGMAGLIGAGRTETSRVIFGADPKSSGECFLYGKKLDINNPKDAINAKIALLTEDRKRTGLCTNLPCSWNITLPNFATINMQNILNLAKEKIICQNLGKKVKVKWSSCDAPADSLSGGNQQKVLLARWLLADSQFLIFDEPTRGIDVGAKKEIYQLLNELAAQGRAILMISSELPELFGVCDRIIVMRNGQVVGNSLTKATSPEQVMRLAALEN